MSANHKKIRAALLGASALVSAASLMAAAPAFAQQRAYQFDLPAQPLGASLKAYGAMADQPIIFAERLVRDRGAPPLRGEYTAEEGLTLLLAGSGLIAERTPGGVIAIRSVNQDPQSGSAAGGGAEVDALIVTAQKREENIQDVPIAMSAFSQETLENRQVAGGPDLITQVPNMSFTKTNFTSYSIQIRGIGTQAISATTDPAVAVAFNNTPFVRNRFFEQEFFDLERLEVLRGPQGTLYGRNATAGVVNLISGKPKFLYEAKASVDIGNYANRRFEGMVNMPLVEDVVALRLAGAWTKRDGYAFNQITGQQIDGRDLWAGRATLRFEPTDWISANLVYEHFEEEDDRLRSGKQLCKKHLVPQLGELTVPAGGGVFGPQTYVSQGCTAVSLYSPEAFQTPNGFALPFYGPTGNISNPVYNDKDPYLNGTQSRDLRVIESSVEPEYRAKSDIAQLQVAVDLGDDLTFNSETSYSTDELFSLQDFNRFTTAPNAFNPSGGISPREGLLDPDGVFCDPQLGCSDRLLLVDLSTSESSQFSQEFRVSSDFDEALNFSLGANFLRHDAEDKYYVFVNSLSMATANSGPGTTPYIPGVTDNSECLINSETDALRGPGGIGLTAPYYDPELPYGVLGCKYMDPNPIGSLNDEGRNYFLSRNPYSLISYAAFGELYYNITPDLKLTGGLRFTVDRKKAPQIRSWLLAVGTAGPYPVSQIVDQTWREPTGRLAIDWSPDLGFTDQTLVYASYAHGYKAGGANPPPPVFVSYTTSRQEEELPDTFGPEFVDAFEVGAKNTLFDGALTLNLTGFYYDYKGYQTSEIRNRSAVNSNFDAEVWGGELEADWRVTEALRLGLKGGYNMTRMADGSNAIDLMDRTAGNADWTVVRPFPTIPSNCIVPIAVATAGGQFHVVPSTNFLSPDGLCVDAYTFNLDPITQRPYEPDPTHRQNAGTLIPLGPAYADYAGFDPASAPNGGRGFSKDLSGNELPNAPNYTATFTVDYTIPIASEWMLTLHGDYHYQADSWGRVFNSDPYDRIEAFSTINVAGILTSDSGWKVMGYVKNIFDETAITGTFLNSDDTGLTTNVFLTEPRLYGLRVTKDWTGLSGFWGLGDGSRRAPGEPHPFTLEIGGGMSRFDRSAEAYRPDWLDEYSATFPTIPTLENEDLDWGDIRSAKLTYTPEGDSWSASAAIRYGKTNASDRGNAYEAVEGGLRYFDFFGTRYEFPVVSPDNHWRGGLKSSEEHTIIDFVVGKEIGMGLAGVGVNSTVSAGVRYAEFTSSSEMIMDGIPDRYVQPVDGPLIPTASFNSRYTTQLASERTFEGAGPSASWDAALVFLGDEQKGHLDVEWTVGGAVLFGKQATDSTEDRLGAYYSGSANVDNVQPPTAILFDEVVERSRREDVTVPNISLGLGLSYTVDRVKVSTGYSYDRYFDAIDGGAGEAQQYDRTIHGPYLKLSLGFGG